MKLPFRILCVCMGNVCRSPTAEAVLRKLACENHLEDSVDIASAGTHGYRVGEASDARSQRVAMDKGYDLSMIRARKIGWQDLEDFDLILAMDRNNLYNMRRLATEEQQRKIRLLSDYARAFGEKEIPDPYTTFGQSFEHVLNLIEDAAEGVIRQLVADSTRQTPKQE